MPRPPGEAEARAKLKAAQRAAEQATKAHAAAEADLRNASAELERVGQAAGLAEATLNHALSELRQVIPGADLGVDDDTLMAPLATASGTAAEAHQRQADEANQLAGQAELAADRDRERDAGNSLSDPPGLPNARNRFASGRSPARRPPESFRLVTGSTHRSLRATSPTPPSEYAIGAPSSPRSAGGLRRLAR